MLELFTTTNLTQAGATIIALYALWVIHKISREFNRTISNHISHHTEATAKLNTAVERLIKFLEKRLK